MYKASIVIPAYNRKHLLKNTLLALNHQQGMGRNDFEVVLVDDGSTDNTRDLVKDMGRNYDLKYLYLPKGDSACYARARNTGWQNAQSELVVFLDSDMIVGRRYLEETIKCFQQDANILLITTRLMLPENAVISEREVEEGTVFERFCYHRQKRDFREIRHEIFNQMSYNMSMDPTSWLFVYSCSIAVPRKTLAVLDGFDEKFIGWGMDDTDLAYRIHKQKLKIVYNYKMECLHQYHPESSKTNYRNNARYFLDKHPELKTSLTRSVIDDMLSFAEVPEHDMTDRAMDECDRMKEEAIKNSQVTVLQLKTEQDVSEARRLVENALHDRDRIIILLDFTEDSDAYIWVQLVTFGSRAKVLYYPMSRHPDGGMQRE